MADSVTALNEDVQRRKDIAESYRTLADLIEEIPELGDEFSDTERILVYVWEDAAEKLSKLARRLPGRVEKVAGRSYFGFEYDMGGGRVLHVYSSRSAVCERVVVGTEKVEVEVEVEPAKTETKTEEREVVEWVCAPLLSKVGA
jgi:hypothetical protein